MPAGSLPLPFEEERDVNLRIDARDREARARAVDPRFNVALEASAGTGKTRVLVERYVNLLRAGVDPANVLAITFTRKAAAEMRERIMATLRAAAARGEIPPSRWHELRGRTADISISTIDAFCLSVLREFPLEADLDPNFSMADETEVPRLIDESLDRALRICRSIAREDANVALVFAQLGARRARAGLAALLNRRLVAPAILARYLSPGPEDLTIDAASRRAAGALLEVFRSMPGGLERFLESGPPAPGFLLLARELRTLESAVAGETTMDPIRVQATLARTREHFLTQDGEARSRLTYAKAAFASDEGWRTQRDLVLTHAAGIARVSESYRRDLNVLVSRGVWRMYQVAATEYRRTLDEHAVLDFPDVLLHVLQLLRQMEEFAQSRYRLESRYHHLLVDELQDTSRAQWELISLLVQSWGEGAGVAYAGPLRPSIFVVGDRKQSIYGFRDADVSMLREAGRYLGGLRGDGDVRRSISRSFRSAPALLSFVNDLCHDIDKAPGRSDAFEYEEQDRFPVDGRNDEVPSLGLVAADSVEACAAIAATEIARLIARGDVIRDRDTGIARAVGAGDVAILFRSRESHREFEEALEKRGIPAYVYKGLGFFDADEIKDVLALLSYLADPLSDLRAAAFLRSRFVGLSDEGLRLLAPGLASALRAAHPADAQALLDEDDLQALTGARSATLRWRGLVDRLPPAEILDVILTESAYARELHGPRRVQAWENLKKMRALMRRIQNRGYVTLGRLTANLHRLAVGDESNAVLDARNAVNLMTVHASKGLEFPVVFLVNLARGTGNRRDAIRVWDDPGGDAASVAIGDFKSDADADQSVKEREETKRLLYVALTRARDRLYLGSVLKDGRLQPGRGSLAEVLPASLVEQFSPASSPSESVRWRASSGAIHSFRWCTAIEEPAAADADSVTHVPTDLGPLPDMSPARQSISAAAVADEHRLGTSEEGRASGRLVGTVVHRMLQRLGFHADYPSLHLRAHASRLLRTEERPDTLEENQLLDDAEAAYRAICARADVHALCSSGERLHEVPFTMRVGSGLLRGTIDCLVKAPDGRITLLEFKTGRPHERHRTQVELYRLAAQRLFPTAPVDVLLVYPTA